MCTRGLPIKVPQLNDRKAPEFQCFPAKSELGKNTVLKKWDTSFNREF